MPNFQQELADLRQQLKATRQEVAYLRGVLTDAGLIVPGWEEVKEAIQRLDFEPYLRFKAAGGVIPEEETEEGGRRGRRSTIPTKGEIIGQKAPRTDEGEPSR